VKKVYREIPSTSVLKREVRRLAREQGVLTPNLNLWLRGDGRYDPTTRTMHLPEQGWLEYYRASDNAQVWWGYVLHEFAHYLDDMWNGKVGHGVSFYSILTGLIFKEGLSLRWTLADEEYIYPSAARKGWKATGTSLLKRKGR
jgi:hypothetical protein